MYNTVTVGAVPVVAGAGTVAVLPETGANSVVIIALAVLAGLVAWGVTYYYRSARADQK